MAEKEKIYEYAGEGEGIPGLPHRVSEAEAKELGVLELLKAAVKAGKYILVLKAEAKEAGKPPKEGE